MNIRCNHPLRFFLHNIYLLLIYFFLPLYASLINPFSINISLAEKYVCLDMFKICFAYVFVYSNGSYCSLWQATLHMSKYNSFAVVDNSLKFLLRTKLSVYAAYLGLYSSILTHLFLCNVFIYQAAAFFIASCTWLSYSVVNCL